MLNDDCEVLEKAPDGESGFSLIELMISMVVLTIGLVSIVAMSSYVARANADSNITSVLATAVQTQMDQLKAATWNVYTCDPSMQVGGSVTSNTTGYYTTISGSPAGNLVVRWQVAQGGTPDYRYVTVNVSPAVYSVDFPNGLTITTIMLRQ